MKILGLVLLLAGAGCAIGLGVLYDPVQVGERNCGHNGTLGECDRIDDFAAGVIPFVVGIPIALVGLLVLLAAAKPEGGVISLRPWRS